VAVGAEGCDDFAPFLGSEGGAFQLGSTSVNGSMAMGTSSMMSGGNFPARHV